VYLESFTWPRVKALTDRATGPVPVNENLSVMESRQISGCGSKLPKTGTCFDLFSHAQESSSSSFLSYFLVTALNMGSLAAVGRELLQKRHLVN
jgi:hypothetical protein